MRWCAGLLVQRAERSTRTARALLGWFRNYWPLGGARAVRTPYRTQNRFQVLLEDRGNPLQYLSEALPTSYFSVQHCAPAARRPLRRPALVPDRRCIPGLAPTPLTRTLVTSGKLAAEAARGVRIKSGKTTCPGAADLPRWRGRLDSTAITWSW